MATEALLRVQLVSPVTTVFRGDAVSLVVPAWDGKIGILPDHAPLISLLGGGEVEMELPGGERRRYFVNRGVLKVEANEVTILTEYASDTEPAGFDHRMAWLELEGAELEEMAGPENPLI